MKLTKWQTEVHKYFCSVLRFYNLPSIYSFEELNVVHIFKATFGKYYVPNRTFIGACSTVLNFAIVSKTAELLFLCSTLSYHLKFLRSRLII